MSAQADYDQPWTEPTAEELRRTRLKLEMQFGSERVCWRKLPHDGRVIDVIGTVAEAWSFLEAAMREGERLEHCRLGGKQATPDKAVFQKLFFDEGEQDTFPDVEWLIEGYLQDHATHVLSGVWGSLKSFLAVEAALAVASGVPAFGKFKVRRSGPVIYLAGEGGSAIGKIRRPVWKDARGVDRPVPFYVSKSVPMAADEASVRAHVEAVRAIAKAHANPVLIVVDTMARALAGLDENSASDAQFYIQLVEGLKDEFGCAVLTIAHEGKSGKADGPRGSSAFPGGFDVVMRVEADINREAQQWEATVTAQKVKDGDDVAPFTVHGRLHTLKLDGAKDRTSLVFDWTAAARKRSAPLTPGQLGAALKKGGALKGETMTLTDVANILAGEFCADPKMRKAQRERVKRAISRPEFAAYVAFRGDPQSHEGTLLTFPVAASIEA